MKFYKLTQLLKTDYGFIPYVQINKIDHNIRSAFKYDNLIQDSSFLMDYYFYCKRRLEDPQNQVDWTLVDVYFQTGHPQAHGFLCNERFANLLKTFDFFGHIFLETKLLFEESCLKYYLFQYINPYPWGCFFENNKVVYKNNPKKLYKKQYNTRDLFSEYRFDFYREPESMMILEIENYLDLFQNPLGGQIIVSERLKDAILSANISGVDLEILDHVDFQFQNIPRSPKFAT